MGSDAVRSIESTCSTLNDGQWHYPSSSFQAHLYHGSKDERILRMASESTDLNDLQYGLPVANIIHRMHGVSIGNRRIYICLALKDGSGSSVTTCESVHESRIYSLPFTLGHAYSKMVQFIPSTRILAWHNILVGGGTEPVEYPERGKLVFQPIGIFRHPIHHLEADKPFTCFYFYSK